MTDECMEAEHEPTWLDKYRQEKGIRVMPMPSRELGDVYISGLTKDVAFNRHSMNDGHHISPTDNAELQVGTDNIRVALVQGIDVDALKRTLSAATRATVGLDMTQPIAAEGDWEEMLKGGLQTALETQTIVLAVGGVSRTATHQLVRSRRASFHQQSQRAGYMGDCPEVRMPESIWVDEEVRNEWLHAIMVAWRAYKKACDHDIAYQDARFILPEGTTNFILLEYTLREFLNVYAYRACSMFQWEIVHVMREAKRVLVEQYPWLEPYIKISCQKTGPAVISTSIPVGHPEGRSNIQTTVPHHCTFQGWEDVEGQCDFTWAKHEARTFKPEFHRITREK